MVKTFPINYPQAVRSADPDVVLQPGQTHNSLVMPRTLIFRLIPVVNPGNQALQTSIRLELGQIRTHQGPAPEYCLRGELGVPS